MSVRKMIIHVLFLQQVLFLKSVSATGTNKCPTINKDCRFKKHSQNYHLDSLSIISFIILNEIVADIVECGEKCNGKNGMKSCAFDTNGNTCYVFNKEFDDIGIALQLDFGWHHIFLLENGQLIVRQKHTPCNREYCKETCLPGYLQTCVDENYTGENCDEYVGAYDSCNHYKTMRVPGKPNQLMNNPASNEKIYPVLTKLGDTLLECVCFFSGSSTYQGLYSEQYALSPSSFTQFPSGAGPENPTHMELKFPVSDEIINTFIGDRSCGHKIHFKLYGIYAERFYLKGWDDSIKKFKSVPGCHSCSKYKSNSNWEKVVYFYEVGFFPIREIIIGDLDDVGEEAYFSNEYIFCSE